MIPRPYYIDIYHEPSSEKAMLFSAGPRQREKTTLTKMIANACVNRLYSIWDIPEDQLHKIYT